MGSIDASICFGGSGWRRKRRERESRATLSRTAPLQSVHLLFRLDSRDCALAFDDAVGLISVMMKKFALVIHGDKHKRGNYHSNFWNYIDLMSYYHRSNN